MINFCFDTIINSDQHQVYPNLGATLQGAYYDICGVFSTIYPFSDPPRLLDYLVEEDIAFELHNSNNCPKNSYYFINVNFFDHSVDWFARMSATTLKNAQNKKFKILFYYCEGDSPSKIRNTLHTYAKKHSVDVNQIHFISHSTVSNELKNFYYFNDDEILYNNAQTYSKSQAEWHNNERSKKFTCLMRSHKNWRFSLGAKFNSAEVYGNAYGSYNKISFSNGFNHTDDFTNADENPLCTLASQNELNSFKSIVPFSADQLSDDNHNNYETFVDKFYTDAFWNIVCETHLDLDDTNGVFITEKTWKPIKHNQPFIIVGTVGSLAHLHSMGYATFDGIIDESYDSIINHNNRVLKILEVVDYLNSKSLTELRAINKDLEQVVKHNSNLFNTVKHRRLTTLIGKLFNEQNN